MSTLSSAGWIAHDVGLATAIGGGIFGQVALEPALKEVANPRERDRISENAWNRFSLLKLVGHVAFAVPWYIGRRLLSGNEVSARARALTRTKDVLVGASLITGIASIVLGRMLGNKIRKGAGPAETRISQDRGEYQRVRSLERAVTFVGTLNLAAMVGVVAVTDLLAMEGSKSFWFSGTSRKLP